MRSALCPGTIFYARTVSRVFAQRLHGRRGLAASQRLTKRLVDALEAVDGKPVVAFDAVLPGFGVRALPSGVKSYFVQYRNRYRRLRWLTIGRHGVLTPSQARQRAQQLLGQVANGQDPAEEKLRTARSPSFRKFSDRFLEEHVDVYNKPSTRRHVRGDLKNHLLPAFGSRAVAEITRDDVARLHLSLRETPVAANRLLRVLSKMMNQAELWGLRPPHSNPCRGIKLYAQRRRERFLSAAEIKALGKAIVACEAKGTADPVAANAIRLILLTGCRPSEITGLRWKEVDIENFMLLLEDSKTGAKVVPLGAPACELLAGLDRDGEYVFPSPKKPGQAYKELRRPWHNVRDKAELPDVQLKDLRHTHASVAAQCGFSLPVIGKLLGHSQVSTTQIYTHWADDVVRHAAERVQGRLAAALSGRPDAEVIPMRPGVE